MWDAFWLQVKERGGLGRGLQWLTSGDSSRTLRYLVSWLNAAAVESSTTEELIDLPPDLPSDLFFFQRYNSSRGVSAADADALVTLQPIG
ncbi:hypothetical protein I317_03544 [Kwoniella heveanensis CBS 569]|nr:hypothetical protein I317_03544 [Kwoniella heveanensis CBS 569]